MDKNTRLTYLYCDANNYKKGNEVIIQGTIRFKDIEDTLDDGEYFIPGQVGMEDLQFRFGKIELENDHPWHKLTEDDFEETDEAPTFPFTANHMIEVFHKVKWDEMWLLHKMERDSIF